jgi:zinc finger protein
MTEKKENLFPTLGDVADHTDATVEDVDEDTKAIREVESLCMRCHESGTTRFLLTTIPYFKEIVVSSFMCDHCGYRDTEVQPAGEIQPKGCSYTVHMLSRADLDRQLVKSNWATVTIPEFQLTIPPGRGQLTTIEGIMRDTVRDLAMEQPVRRIMDKETADKIDALLAPLREALDMEEGDEDGEVGRDGPAVMHESDAHSDKPFKPFTLTLDDPSGNSFLAFKDSTNDPQWNLRAYNRTFEQNVTLGLVAPKEEGEEATTKIGSADEFYQRHRANVVEHDVPVPEEVFSFPASCSSCGHELETRMKQINIPYFEEVILMSSTCPTCGYKDNEVKSGGKIKPLGKKVTLKIEAGDEDALSRDILKSDTCGLAIPEIDLVLQPGTLGGRFTTVEGILNEIYDELSTKVFRTGDSGTAGHAQGAIGEAIVAGDRNFEQFLQGLKDVMAVKNDFTLILDDPLSNSYHQNTNAPDPDPDMTIEEYERTKEQNDDLGLSDMKVEGYNPDIKDKL